LTGASFDSAASTYRRVRRFCNGRPVDGQSDGQSDAASPEIIEPPTSGTFGLATFGFVVEDAAGLVLCDEWHEGLDWCIPELGGGVAHGFENLFFTELAVFARIGATQVFRSRAKLPIVDRSLFVNHSQLPPTFASSTRHPYPSAGCRTHKRAEQDTTNR
jgi:hypothetical protein